MSLSADRNLLFGILALQMDFVSRDQLIAGMHAWVLEKSQPLGELLVRQGAMNADDRADLERMVDRHVQKHQGDPAQSLASVSSVASSLREALRSLGDPVVDTAVQQLSLASADPFATESPSMGSASVPGVRFRILRPHAKGGLGQVSVALDTELNREVAFKEIQPPHADHGESRSRFEIEAAVTGRLEHPGIVPVYGMGHYPDGRPFYAMKFIEGNSLVDAIRKFHGIAAGRRGPDFVPRRLDSPDAQIELRKLLGRLIDVCDAISFAHRRGVLHRDLKPGNIMLGEHGETLVVDWGLAKVLGKSAEESGSGTPPEPVNLKVSLYDQTMAGMVRGTPQYMSPEQASGKLDVLGPQTDVYAIGATLYDLLTGRPPVAGKTVEEVLKHAREGEIVPIREVNPTIPKPLQAICEKALTRDWQQRYPTAQALSEDLQRWLADEPVSVQVDSWSDRAARWVRRNRKLAVSAGIALALVAIISVVATLLIQASRSQALMLAGKNKLLAEENAKVALQKQAANAKLAQTNTELNVSREAVGLQAAATQQRLALSLLERGVRDCENGHFDEGLHGLLAGYQGLKKDDPLRKSGDRLLHSWIRHAPRSLPHASNASSGFLAGGRRAWTADNDTLYLWSTTDWRLLSRIHQPIEYRILQMAVDPSGKYVACAYDEGPLNLFDAGTGKLAASLKPLEKPLEKLEFSSDGRILLADDREQLAWWDVTSKKEIGRVRPDNFGTALVTPDGASILYYSEKQALRYDVATASPSPQACEHGEGTVDVHPAFGDPQVTHLTVVTREGHEGCGDLRYWSAVAGKPVLPDWDWSVAGMTTAPRPQKLLGVHPTSGIAVTTGDNRVQLWDVWKRVPRGEAFQLAPDQPVPDSWLDLAFSADASTVAVVGQDDRVRCWSTQTGRPLGPAITHEGIHDQPGLSLSRDGRRILTRSALQEQEQLEIRVWDIAAARQIGGPWNEHKAANAWLSSDGHAVTVQGLYGWHRIEAETAKILAGPIVQPGFGQLHVNPSHDGRVVVTYSNEFMSLWNAETGESLGRPLRHELPFVKRVFVEGASLSADNSRIFTATSDRDTDFGTTVSQWKWTQRGSDWVQEPVKLEDLEIMSPTADRRIMATEEPELQLSIRDGNTGEDPVEIPGADLRMAIFSPDGKSLLAQTSKDPRRLWIAPQQVGTAVYDAGTGQRRGDFFQLPRKQSLSAKISPDRRWLVTRNGGTSWTLWNLKTLRGTALPLEDNDTPQFSTNSTGLLCLSGKRRALLFNPDSEDLIPVCQLNAEDDWRSVQFVGEQELLTDAYDTLQRYSIPNGERVGDAWTLPDDLDRLAVSRDGSRMLAYRAFLDSEVTLWDVPARKKIRTSWLATGSLSFEVASDRLHAIAYNGHQLRVLDNTTLETVGDPLAPLEDETFELKARGMLLGISPNGVRRIELATAKILEPACVHNGLAKAALSSDGSACATVGSDGSVRLWELQSGRLLSEFRCDAVPNLLALATVDGSTAETHDGSAAALDKIRVVAANEGFVRRWTGAGVPVGESWSANNDIQLVAPLAESRLLVVTQDTIQVRGLGAAEDLQSRSVESSALAEEVTFSRDSTLLLGQADESVGLWSAATGEQVAVITLPGEVLSARFLEQGQRIAVAHPKAVSIFDSATRSLLKRLDVGHDRFSIAVSPSFSRLAVTANDEVQLWDLNSFAKVGPALLKLKTATSEFSPDGRWLMVCDTVFVRIVDARTGAATMPLASRPEFGFLNSTNFKVHFSPASDWAFIEDFEMVSVIPLPPEPVQGMRLRPDGTIDDALWTETSMVLAVSGSELCEYSVPFGVPVRRFLDAQTSLTSMALGAGEVIAAGNDRSVRRWDLRSGQALAPVWLKDHAWDVGSAGRDRFWARTKSIPRVFTAQPHESRNSSTRECWYQFWPSGATAAVAEEPRPISVELSFPDLNPDGRWLVASSNSSEPARLMSMSPHPENGEGIALSEDPDSELNAIAWRPDGRQLALVFDRHVVVRDLATGKSRQLEFSPDKRAFSVAYSPDGGRLTVGTENHLWHWASESLEPLETPWRADLTTAIAFSPDGSLLASAEQIGGTESEQHQLQFWDVPLGLPLGKPILLTDKPSRLMFDPASAWLLVRFEGTAEIFPAPADTATLETHWQHLVECRTQHKRKDASDRDRSKPQAELVRLTIGEWHDRCEALPAHADQPLEPSFRRRVRIAEAVASSEWRLALAGLDAALPVESASVDSAYMRTRTQIELKQFSEALQAAATGLSISPSDERLVRLQLVAHVRLNDWEAARADAQRVVELCPGNVADLVRLGLVHLGLRQQVEFEAVRTKLLGDFANSKDGYVLDEAAYFSVLTPLSHEQADMALRLAKEAVDSSVSFRMHSETLAAAEYRAGRFQAGIDRLQGLIGSSNTSENTPWMYWFLAMAHARLGQKGEARINFDHGDANWSRRRETATWMDRIRFEVLRSEVLETLTLQRGGR